MKKRVLSTVLVICMLCALFPASILTASAETFSGSCGEQLVWKLDTETGVLEITGTGEMTDAPWSSYCDSIKSVIIGNGVTGIREYAFENCTSLTGVTIPDSVTDIRKYAFENCTSLTDVTIPDSVTSIGYGAFRDCTSLTGVTIPDSVTNIGDYAFRGCTSLTGIWVDENNPNYSSDEKGVLFNKDKTKLIQYPGGYAGDYTIPDSVTDIRKYAFEDCTSLTGVTIPNSVTSIGEAAFEDCTSLTGVTIPNSVTNIGYSAFSGCTSLTGMAIPSSVIGISWRAFGGCTSLTGIWVAENNPKYSNDEKGALFNKDKTELLQCPGGYVGNYNIPDSVTVIDGWAFYGCTSLTGVTIPSSVTGFGWGAFSGCTSLTGIWVDENNPNYSSDEKGVLFNKNKTKLLHCPRGYIGDYTIPDSVTSIDEYAFNGCAGLSGVTIPNSVTIIWEGAFYGCTSLAGVTIPDSVTDIGNFAFRDCIGLQSVCFQGDAPDSFYENAFKVWDDETETLINIPGLTLYYIEGKEGWTSPSWKGYPTATWDGVNFPHIHSYQEMVTAPTCTEQGYTTHTCTVCGDSYVDTYVDALGHDYGDWTQTKAPTCTEKGAEKRTCSRCDTFETREIGALGHTEVVDAAVPATCTEAGKTEGKHCSVCNTVLVVQKKIPALGHDFGEWTQEKAPTCTEKGAEKRTCSRCDTFETREIDALGHKYENGVCVQCGEKDPNEQPTIEFVDVPQKAWYVEAVNYAVQNGLMNGVGNDQFNPEGSMTRAMLVTVLWRYEGEPEAGENTFSDVPNGQWYTNAVAWAAENGIVGGVGNNRFDPNGEITREQMATILFRYAEKKGIDTSKRGSLNIFSDEKQLSAYAKDAVQWAVAEQIINGSDGKLLPQGNATRAQVSAILMRFIENKIK